MLKHTHTYNQEMGESEGKKKEEERTREKKEEEIIIFLFSTFLPSSSSFSILTSVLREDFATIGEEVYYRERERTVVVVNSKSVCFESCRADADGRKRGRT